jgi:hypothetical protein
VKHLCVVPLAPNCCLVKFWCCVELGGFLWLVSDDWENMFNLGYRRLTVARLQFCCSVFWTLDAYRITSSLFRLAYEQLVFCDIFHQKESGWRDCSFCGKVRLVPQCCEVYSTKLRGDYDSNGLWYFSIFIADVWLRSIPLIYLIAEEFNV